jgi:hypothetical protein
MNIEVDKFYKTRSGCKVTIYSTIGRGEYSIHGTVMFQDLDGMCSWTNSGRYSIAVNNLMSILSKWKEPPLELWVNEYDNGFYGYLTKDQADRMTNEGTLKCIHMWEVQDE